MEAKKSGGLLNKALGLDKGAGRPSKDRQTVERGERSQVPPHGGALAWSACEQTGQEHGADCEVVREWIRQRVPDPGAALCAPQPGHPTPVSERAGKEGEEAGPLEPEALRHAAWPRAQVRWHSACRLSSAGPAPAPQASRRRVH